MAHVRFASDARSHIDDALAAGATAISVMNDGDFDLTASLWTKDLDRAEHVANAIENGTVYMNRCRYLDPALCWTGRKDTGRTGGLSAIGYHNLNRPKSYNQKKAK